MKLNGYITLLVLTGVLLGSSVMSLADTNPSSLVFYDSGNVEEEVSHVDFEDVEQADVSSGNTEAAEDFLNQLNRELNLSRADYKQLLNTIHDTRKRLELASEDKLTLEEQMKNIDGQIEAVTSDLVFAIKNILEKENKIALLMEQIEIREVALGHQKNLVRNYIRLLYQEENNLLSFADDGSVDTIKFLLADGSVSENIRDLDYLDLLRETGVQLIDKLAEISEDLEQKNKNLYEARAKLEEMKERFEIEKAQLEIQKQSKQDLLRLTRGQETIYQQLLEQTEKEQEQMIEDIRSLAGAVSFVQAKIEEEGDDFDIEKYSSILQKRDKALYQLHFDGVLQGTTDFVWPVDTGRGISAYFRDSSYYGVFGVQHNAIDIPIYQGSPVRAVADSVVYTTRDNGYGYSYIILAHSNGLMTVYGHMSAILVDEGQMVKQGAIIGLSGGMPGTLGAGYMTTGPHLHFEVLQNGSYVDPLKYLPLEILTEEQVRNQLPEKYYSAWEEAVFKSMLEPVQR
jgi:murein DD-endopeptidase MepM/ murein hydrolase activator NlpD